MTSISDLEHNLESEKIDSDQVHSDLINDTGIEFFLKKNGSDDLIIKKLIDESADLEKTFDNQKRLIHYVSKFCSPNMIIYLINKGVNLDVEDSRGKYPIHYICRYSTLGVLKYVVENTNVDLDVVEKYTCFTILYFASMSKDLNKIKYLVEEIGVGLPEPTTSKYSILHCVAEFSTVEIFQYFENLGYNLNMVNEETGYTPLGMAVNFASEPYTSLYLIEKSDDLDQDIEGNSLIHIASIKKNLAIIQALVENGVDINLPNNCDDTPLHICCGDEYKYHLDSSFDEKYTDSNYDLVRYLLSKEADPNCVNDDGFYPIHIAIMNREEEISLLLLDSDNLDIVDRSGNKLTHYAVKYQNLKLIKKLVEYGVDLEEENNQGLKPVHLLTNLSLHELEDFVKFCDFSNYLFEINMNFEAETRDGKKLIQVFQLDNYLNYLIHHKKHE